MPAIRLQNKNIGLGHPPFIVAELSGNHNGEIARAKAIVDAAAKAGADAVKLQTYTADTMTLPLRGKDFTIHDDKSLWRGRTLYELYQEAHTPWEWHAELFDHARRLGLVAFSTPFDATAVDFLERLEAPLYKIASFENGDLALIRKVAATGKPVVISTGTATLAEIAQAVETARGAGVKDLILLKCTSAYPAPASDVHLRTIPHLRELFGVEAGLSDHTQGIGAAVAATALGACMIEKHVTLSREEGGVDAAFSLEPPELAALVREVRTAFEALGQVRYALAPSEVASRQFRRSLYAVAPVKKGERFTSANVRAIRPGYGLPPAEYEHILARGLAACDLQPGVALARHHIVYGS